MNKDKVVLGYSGGVDSNAAIGILRERGFEVVALHLDMCGDQQSVEKARNSALSAGVKFDTINCEKLFQKEIKDYFVAEYVAGRTPAPCTRCNPFIKWRLLLEYANENDIYYIATGHYFQIEEYNNKLYVSKALDPKKDQSYYLWGLSQEVLQRAITPMSNIIKEQINTTKRKESMGVCFLSGRRYGDYLTEVCGPYIKQGNIVNKQGEIMGQHKGLAYYTVGQKRGDGLPSGTVVISVDGISNALIIGEDADLYHLKLYIDKCNIVDRDELLNTSDIRVVVRGIGRNPDGYISKVEEYKSGFIITLSSSAWACAAGQPVVLYRRNRVIGGGYLERSF